MTGRKAPTHVDKIVIGQPKFHLETQNCPARVASRKKIHKKRAQMQKLAREMQHINADISKQQKAAVGNSKGYGRKNSIGLGKKKGPKGKRRKQKRKEQAGPLGFDYNGMPIYYEDDPGEHGVSSAFDNFVRRKEDREQTLESWETFADQKTENSQELRREDEEREFVKQMQQANLKDVFDSYETAHAARGGLQEIEKETRESAKGFVQMYLFRALCSNFHF